MGRHEVGFVENTEKIPLNKEKGCRFEGRFYINKVPGNFHVSTHSAKVQPDHIDMAHVIHSVSFGNEINELELENSFNPLKGKDKLNAQGLTSLKS